MIVRKTLWLLVVTLVAAGCSSDSVSGDNDATDDRVLSSRLSELLGSEKQGGFPLVLEPREFVFPADHASHPSYRNEWWYLTGNLDGATGRRYGYELTLFRFALAPTTTAAEGASNWRSRQVYIGHFALTDVARGDFHVAQRYAREALGLAGASGDPLRVWLDDWSIKDVAGPDDRAQLRWQISASDDNFAVQLELETAEPPVLNGDSGLSQKSDEAGNASYYYSMPRLGTTGEIRVGDTREQVTGLSWLDREWGSSALAANQRGWDWFALQLDDGSNLMFYRLRRNDGSADPMSAGTWMPVNAASRPIDANEVELEVQRYWDSPRGGRYPLDWRMRIPTLGVDLEIEPVLDAQELQATVRYWEGAVDATGSIRGQPIAGRGYVELTGYDRAER